MISEDIIRKFWKHVEDELNNIKFSKAYYCGGSLSVPLLKKRGICLNIDGTGFVLNTDPHMKNQKLYQPKFILEKVRKIYLKEKGKTEYYKKHVKRK